MITLLQLALEGCTNGTACNFNPNAETGDGSCGVGLCLCDPVTFTMTGSSTLQTYLIF